MVGFSNPHREMLLPPAAMPWGRWVENGILENAESITEGYNQNDIAQSLFNAKADSLSDQIYAVSGVGYVDMYDVPDFTRSFAGYTTSFYTQYVHSSDIVVSIDRAPSNGFIFAELHAEWVSGSAPERLLDVTPLITILGVDSLTTESSQPKTMYTPTVYPSTFHGSVWTLFDNNVERGRERAFTVRFSLGSNYFGTTANPLTVKFTKCRIGVVQIGTLQA